MVFDDQDSQKLFINAFKHSPIGVVLLSPTGRWLKVNPFFCRLVGYSEEELRSMIFSDITHQEDLPENIRLAKLLLNSDISSYQQEKRYIHKNGHPIWANTHVSLVANDNGEPQYIIAQVQDISESKRSNNKLEESEQRYRSLIDFHPDLIYSLSSDGDLLDMNGSCKQLTGYESWELKGIIKNRHTASLCHPAELEKAERSFRLTAEGQPQHFELSVVHKDGHTVELDVTNVPIRVNGAVVGVYGIAKDITELKRNRAKLQTTHELYMLISDNAQDVISYTTPDGITRYISPAIRHLLGYEPHEVTGKPATDYYHPEDAERWINRRFKDSDSFICRIRHKEGHYVWFESTFKFIRNETGALQKILGIGRNITERMESELRQLKSQRSLAQAQRIAKIGSWEWDVISDEVEWSDEMYSIFGVDKEEFIGSFTRIAQYIHPDDYEMYHQRIQDALEGKPYNFDCRLRLSDGTVRYVHIQGVVSFDNEGHGVYAHGIVQDISEQKQLQLLLEESVERYNSLKMYNPDAVISLNLDGTFSYVNEAMHRITGFSMEELKDKHIWELVHQDEKDHVSERIRLIFTHNMLESTEFNIVHKNGHTVTLVATPVPIIIRGVIEGCYIIAKDITEQKMKDDLIKNSEKLNVAGQLAAGVAHEIRNPLTSLKGFLQIMDEAQMIQKKEHLTIMKEEITRIESIVNEMLLLAKPQERLNLRHIDLLPILKHVITLLESQANLRNIRLVTDFRIQREQLYVRCDQNSLKQVFINLIKNAIESMRQGGVVKIVVTEKEESASVQVIDQGCGIPPEQLKRLGEPFYTTKESGTGLGLMVCYKIIQNHGGTIHVKSSAGKGTIFSVQLPARS